MEKNTKKKFREMYVMYLIYREFFYPDFLKFSGIYNIV